MKKLLFQLDTDLVANSFDTVIGYDAGADHVITHSGITPENVTGLVEGAIFTRPPKEKKNTALFITGSNMAAGAKVFAAVQHCFFSNFRVSVMLDSSGGNTAAAAAVARIVSHGPLAGKKAVILAGTGPVGQRAGVLLARQGVAVTLTSRKQQRAAAACADMHAAFGVTLSAAGVNDQNSTNAVLEAANIVITTGAGGVQLISEQQWAEHPSLEILVDANSTPPLGIEAIKMTDRAERRHGKLTYGSLGFGNLKLDLHKACIARMFESNDQTFDAEEVYSLACELL
jgi:hypothetical protein